MDVSNLGKKTDAFDEAQEEGGDNSKVHIRVQQVLSLPWFMFFPVEANNNADSETAGNVSP